VSDRAAGTALRALLERPHALADVEDLLARDPSLAGVRAAAMGDDRARGPWAHVAAVVDRVERAAAGDDDAWLLKLVALVHEAPRETLGMIADAGFADAVPIADAILSGFGEIWKARDAADVGRIVASRSATLRALLLFEVAHEDAATTAMRAAARAGGLERELDGWLARLAATRRHE